jgi:hypothetical protein
MLLRDPDDHIDLRGVVAHVGLSVTARAIRGERALDLVKGVLTTSTRGHSADGTQGYGGDAC